MNELWRATFFCLALSDPTCARMEGAVGNMSFDHSQMCQLLVTWGTRYYREKLGVPLAGVCWQQVGDYVPIRRPRTFTRAQLGAYP